MSEEEEERQYWQAKRREYEEWPQRLERLCREAEARWRAAHPWTRDPAFCVSVPVRRLFIR